MKKIIRIILLLIFGYLLLALFVSLMVLFFAFTLFIIGRSVWDIIKINRDINHLTAEKQQYLQSIAEDSAAIARLRYDEYLEEYARENFHMQREGEQIYIFNED